MINYITDSIAESKSLKEELLCNDMVLQTIESVGRMIYKTVKSGKKVLLCGNGGSAADAQHIAAEFVGRFSTERVALAAISLTTDTSILTAVSNDYGFDSIFERQVAGLGREGDILIALTTSGNSKNIRRALEMAREKQLTTVGFLGGTGGVCRELCDSSFVINSSKAARVQEMHILIGHILCGIVDKLVAEGE